MVEHQSLKLVMRVRFPSRGTKKMIMKSEFYEPELRSCKTLSKIIKSQFPGLEVESVQVGSGNIKVFWAKNDKLHVHVLKCVTLYCMKIEDMKELEDAIKKTLYP